MYEYHLTLARLSMIAVQFQTLNNCHWRVSRLTQSADFVQSMTVFRLPAGSIQWGQKVILLMSTTGVRYAIPVNAIFTHGFIILGWWNAFVHNAELFQVMLASQGQSRRDLINKRFNLRLSSDSILIMITTHSTSINKRLDWCGDNMPSLAWWRAFQSKAALGLAPTEWQGHKLLFLPYGGLPMGLSQPSLPNTLGEDHPSPLCHCDSCGWAFCSAMPLYI